MSDSAFDSALSSVLAREGGFQNDPADPGNWTGGVRGRGICKGTKWGISARAYPDLDIANLTQDQARAIYHRDVWEGTGCDVLPSNMADEVFDMAVNSGAGNAARCLQRAVKVADDGHIGPVTRAAIAQADPDRLLARFEAHRLLFLTQCTAWATYGRGWAIRVGREILDAMDEQERAAS